MATTGSGTEIVRSRGIYYNNASRKRRLSDKGKATERSIQATSGFAERREQMRLLSQKDSSAKVA